MPACCGTTAARLPNAASAGKRASGACVESTMHAVAPARLCDCDVATVVAVAMAMAGVWAMATGSVIARAQKRRRH